MPRDHSVYNEKWTSPSKDANGSMPIGNGDIGLNLWAEDDGRIHFYISKTDAWSDNGRLLKVGKVIITSEPQIRFDQERFKQELDLQTGTIVIDAAGKVEGKDVELTYRIWADANHPVIHVSSKSNYKLSISAQIDLWRTERSQLLNTTFSDLHASHSNFQVPREKVIVEPDMVLETEKEYIGWYHHNAKSEGIEYVNNLQGLSDYPMEDPLLHRTFGAIVNGSKTSKQSDTKISSRSAMSNCLNIYVLTEHPSSPDQWLSSIEKTMKQVESLPFKKRFKDHESWWTDFWNRSWIQATTPDTEQAKDDAYYVSRMYALQRFINACGARGDYPIKFNGSIFTVPPFDREGDADFRWWGPGFWWQNTRLPYIGMCTSGDFDLMHSLFDTYTTDIYEVAKYRTKNNFGFEGAYFIECLYFWGAQFAIDYGPTPWEEREDKLQDSGYHKWEWVAGPELVFMLLDHYDHTGDETLLKQKTLPIADDILKFFDGYYETNEAGKLVMFPSQAVETWWDCTNPMPELSGLHAIADRLLALPDEIVGAENRANWKAFRNKLPTIPVRETVSGPALAPAERFEMKRNVENPELYPVFPFRQYGIGRPDIHLAENALEHRWDLGNFGWRQDDIFKAYLGMADEVAKDLVVRAKNSHEQSRFPAFWGPNYDWVPDQDHGGILLKTFQSMVMQTDPYSNKIYLKPAWPENWDVSFKLHAPHKTVIQGKIAHGKIELESVTPAKRRNDIVQMD